MKNMIVDSQYKFPILQFYLFISISSLCAFIGSIFFEHILLYKPCILCLIERYSFLTICILSLILRINNHIYLQYILNSIVCFMIGFFIYHILVEFHIIGDELCRSKKLPINININNFKEFLMQEEIISCAKKSPIVLYTPLTVWGLLLYLTYLSGIILNYYKNLYDKISNFKINDYI